MQRFILVSAFRNFGMKKTVGILAVFFIPELRGAPDTKFLLVSAFRSFGMKNNPCAFFIPELSGSAGYKDF